MKARIIKPDKTLFGTISLPLSKSISNRLLILQYLHPGKILAPVLSAADDTVLLETLLNKVREYRNRGNKRILALDVNNSGTVMRFLIAMLAATPGSYLLRGDPRMSERPVRILVEALKELGADIQFIENNGFLPVFIKGRNLLSREITVDASESSQHISALLLVSTVISDGLKISLMNQVASRPYIDMTCKVIERCGFPVIWQEELIRVFPGKKVRASLLAEPDWSSTSFWFGMMALAEEGRVTFLGLVRTGLQGDETAVELFSQLGVKSEETLEGLVISKGEIMPGKFEWDFTDCPDLAVPVIVCCALLGKESVFRGLEGLRIKESDRISALQDELRKLNGDLIPDYGNTWRLKTIKTKKKKLVVNSHADHRIAMAMMMAAMQGIEVEMSDPEVVSKSYPGFWRDMRLAGFIT